MDDQNTWAWVIKNGIRPAGLGLPRAGTYTWLMECKGVVVGREGELVRVRVTGRECAECGACGIFSRGSAREVEFEAHDEAGVQEGDEVILLISDRSVLGSFFAAFGLPLLAMVIAYLLAYLFFSVLRGGAHQGAAVAAAVAAGGVSFWWSVKVAGRKLIRPRVTSVIRETATGRVEHGEGGRPLRAEYDGAEIMEISPVSSQGVQSLFPEEHDG